MRSLFGEHIVKTGIMDREFADTLREVFDARQLSDYEVYAEFSVDEVDALIDKAEKFLDAVNNLIRNAS